MSEFSLILVLQKENKQNSNMTWQKYNFFLSSPTNLPLSREEAEDVFAGQGKKIGPPTVGGPYPVGSRTW